MMARAVWNRVCLEGCSCVVISPIVIITHARASQNRKFVFHSSEVLLFRWKVSAVKKTTTIFVHFGQHEAGFILGLMAFVVHFWNESLDAMMLPDYLLAYVYVYMDNRLFRPLGLILSLISIDTCVVTSNL